MYYSEGATNLIAYLFTYLFIYFLWERLNLEVDIGLFYGIVFPETGNGSGNCFLKRAHPKALFRDKAFPQIWKALKQEFWGLWDFPVNPSWAS